jgi:hypothetical protein
VGSSQRLWIGCGIKLLALGDEIVGRIMWPLHRGRVDYCTICDVKVYTTCLTGFLVVMFREVRIWNLGMF